MLGMQFEATSLDSISPLTTGQITTITLKAPDTQKAQVIAAISNVEWNGNK
jgi:hypothetical protein